MKKTLYVLILSLVVISGLVFSFSSFANDSKTKTEIKKETKPVKRTLSNAEKKSMLEQRKKWEASPDGIKFNDWKNSPEGKKVQASYEKIKNEINAFDKMEAIVTSVTFQFPTTNPSSPKWLVVKINGEDYMMQFSPNDFEKFKNLKVDDKIFIRSRSAGFSHNHPYLILSSDYIEHNNKVLFERDLSKNDGC
ncbi:hypothetical protein [Flavobacterium sp.]|uniref:hypothetical protein n=1 Tax=Flavobacterium sp. TaxID=239 RepID=UPI0008BF3816|nr:hypothetical protein [Flavobacterium sp.]OGS62418.1 MAG: hypothetical protein A2X07_05850 [Flavobacteria bacterium GWF1_32_7]HBD26876.1 hypothetical protein [Flavobacterium sp.]